MTSPELHKNERCAYLRACYLAEALHCFGYKTDCPLFRRSNGEQLGEDCFHQAMDDLIDKTKASYEQIR